MPPATKPTPMLSMKTSSAGLSSRARSSAATVAHNHRAMLNGVLGPPFAAAARRAPADTGRYRRGSAMCALAMGQSITIPTLKASRFAKRWRELLDQQVSRFEYAITEAEKKLRETTATGVRLDRLRQRVERAKKRLARAKEEIAKYEAAGGAAIVIPAGKGRQLTTVRAKLYGGSVAFRQAGDESKLTARNREPHALIVESRRPIVGPALAAGKPALAQRFRLSAQVGWKKGAG